MKKEIYKKMHREARLGNLGSLCFSVSREEYRWFLSEVYDLRFPRIGDRQHLDVETFRWRNWRCKTLRQLEAFHNARGWWHCGHKTLLRLWVEFRSVKTTGTP